LAGSERRDYYFAKALGERTQLTYAYFSERGGESPSPERFPFCESLIAIPASEMYTPRKILRGMFGRWRLPVVNYSSPAMAEAVRKIVSGNSFDLVHLDSVHMASYVPLLGRARVVYCQSYRRLHMTHQQTGCQRRLQTPPKPQTRCRQSLAYCKFPFLEVSSSSPGEVKSRLKGARPDKIFCSLKIILQYR
jgi:hypothetical protein